jgi:hypothetical protein
MVPVPLDEAARRRDADERVDDRGREAARVRCLLCERGARDADLAVLVRVCVLRDFERLALELRLLLFVLDC